MHDGEAARNICRVLQDYILLVSSPADWATWGGTRTSTYTWWGLDFQGRSAQGSPEGPQVMLSDGFDRMPSLHSHIFLSLDHDRRYQLSRIRFDFTGIILRSTNRKPKATENVTSDKGLQFRASFQTPALRHW